VRNGLAFGGQGPLLVKFADRWRGAHPTGRIALKFGDLDGPSFVSKRKHMPNISAYRRISACSLLFASMLSGAITAHAQTEAPQASQPIPATKELRAPDVIFVPTPQNVVDAMLDIAKVGKGDVLYDLGSGDGRIPITAAQKYGVSRSVGIDISPERIKEAEENKARAAVGDRVRFINGDLFESKLSDASVVTLYLLPSLNLKLLPKLLRELKPGTRVVSHAFDMGGWKPKRTLDVDGRTIYFWTIPAPNTPDHAAAMSAASKGL
jgi:precorrin-6B methylase 2